MPDGRAVDLFILQNSRGSKAAITNFGGTLVRLELASSSGPRDVVLGYDGLPGYLDNRPYFGASIGRYGNRIARAELLVQERLHPLDENEPPHHLHGGRGGFHAVLWQAEASDTQDGGCVRLRHTSPSGDQGYPGAVSVSIVYTLTHDDTLRIDYAAATDAATHVNLTHHSYFNLAGVGSIEGHLLRIAADAYTPTDEGQIPLGTLESVAGTPFDFVRLTAIGQRIHEDDPQLRIGSGYDHNFVLNDWDGSLREVAEVIEPDTGLRMLVSTTEPGLQFYSGNHLTGIVGKAGHVHAAREGLCLEAQHFPDAPHQPGFPSTLLLPGQEYRQTTQYRFEQPG